MVLDDKESVSEMTKHMSNTGFKAMAFLFKIRDKRNPPTRYLEEAGVEEGKKVLDYGCGPGSFTLPAAELVGAKGIVFGADIHPLAVKTIEKKAEKRGLNNIVPILTDCDTELEAESIDIVLLYDVIHMFKDPEKILTEMYRVTKKKGILSVSNPHMKKEAIMKLIEENSEFELRQQHKKTFSFQKK